MRSSGVAYLLWLLCFFGLCGIHRLYAGKVVTGLLWLFTLGLLGFGQLIDLVLIPGMIERANLKWAVLNGAQNRNVNTNNVVVNVTGLQPVAPPPAQPVQPAR